MEANHDVLVAAFCTWIESAIVVHEEVSEWNFPDFHH